MMATGLRYLRIALVAACTTGCGASATQALIGDALPPEREPPEEAERYVLSRETTSVAVRINGVVSYTLAFGEVNGELLLVADEPEASIAKLVVVMESAHTDNKEIEKIAKSEDFLHVEKYPEARFEVRRLDKNADDDMYAMLGVLELHGTEKAITVPFALSIDACRTVATSEFAVNRRQFGVESDTFLDGMASDEVDIRVAIRVPRRTAPAHCTAQDE